MQTPHRIRVLVAGSLSEVTRALADLLLTQSDIHVVGASPELLKVPENAWKQAPHVILLYVRGAQFARDVVHEVLVKLPDARLLLVIPSFNNAQAVEILEHGARGILSAEQEYEQGVRGQMSSAQRIRVLIAGSRSTEARALEELLLQQSDIFVVGESPEIRRIPETMWKRAPHAILIHLRGAQLAIEAVQEVLSILPDARLLVILQLVSANQAAQILEHGARGVMAIDQQYSQGVRAIRSVHAGELWGSRTVLSLIAQTAITNAMEAQSYSKSLLNLTGREREVVDLLRDGSSNKQIASQLNISDKTVKTHMQNIFGKLQVSKQCLVTCSCRERPERISCDPAALAQSDSPLLLAAGALACFEPVYSKQSIDPAVLFRY